MFFIKRNLPQWERALRITIGLGMVWAVWAGLTMGIVSWIAGATAATMLLTAFVGFCPACALAGRRYLEK
ncbi:YgaP family membrane protein [Iodobacter fluviatilis]|uniref:DUF2892 family protein n=1 Tax=Iodobacter fluviatilis TaxID=537 RepID=A0A377Q3D4_9NEIS|nr:DUF2892 domain-containing protein [Iodobacter fluviatilis]TCU90052.1 DUF2892 family protein [Iodobacter fluviatilis]STQ89079.1 Protein of uncharacterised function (DUF2892) [Iodobacter fluviatilis]